MSASNGKFQKTKMQEMLMGHDQALKAQFNVMEDMARCIANLEERVLKLEATPIGNKED